MHPMNAELPPSEPAGRDDAVPAGPPRLLRRGTVVIGVLLMALLAFATTTQDWLTVALPQGDVQTPDLAVSGSDAATPVTALALVAAAGALALSIAGRITRWIISAALAAAGAGIAVVSFGVAADPAAAARPAIGAALGINDTTRTMVEASAMPSAAGIAGLLLILAALWAVLASRSWPGSRRYETRAQASARRGVAATAHSTDIDQWDRLTEGEDPTR